VASKGYVRMSFDKEKNPNIETKLYISGSSLVVVAESMIDLTQLWFSLYPFFLYHLLLSLISPYKIISVQTNEV